MKAIFQVKYGAPDDLELREVDKPAVGDDEVLVRLRAASVHPDVWHVVSGRPYVLLLMGAGFSKPKNPIPGTDMAGIVESVGRSVTRFRRGDEVFGETVGSSWSNGGAFSEYVSVRQDSLALKPDNITFAQAADVPFSEYVARTATEWRNYVAAWRETGTPIFRYEDFLADARGRLASVLERLGFVTDNDRIGRAVELNT
jgi:NADPH:quinone reductase-like Zn-dependent oxidoreductase